MPVILLACVFAWMYYHVSYTLSNTLPQNIINHRYRFKVFLSAKHGLATQGNVWTTGIFYFCSFISLETVC